MFYIILSGTVGVCVRPDKSNEEILNENPIEIATPLPQNSEEDPPEVFKRSTKKKATTVRPKETPVPTATEEIIVNPMIQVRTMSTGMAFGELALLSNKPRAATINCITECEFAVLDKSDFNRILKAKEEKRLIEEMNFFSNMRIFSGWNFHAVKFLYVNSNQITFKRNEVVFREGDEADGMYVIKSGTFLLSKDITLYDVYEASEFAGTIAQSKNKSLARAVVKRRVELSIMTANDHFGEESSIKNSKREYNVTCLSIEGVVRKVDLKNFTNRVMREENSKQRLEKIAANKEEWLLQRIEEVTNNIMRERKFLNQMNFARNFTEPDSVAKSKVFKGSIVNDTGRLKLKAPLVRHNKLTDFDLREQLNEESMLKNGDSMSIAELKNKFQHSFMERMSNFDKGMSKLRTENSFKVKYFLERLPKPRSKRNDSISEKKNQMIDDLMNSKNIASLSNQSYSFKENMQTDLIDRFEKSQNDVSIDGNFSLKKKLIRRLLANGSRSNFQENKKTINSSGSGSLSMSINLSRLSEKGQKDDITEIGLSPIKREFLKKIKEGIVKKYQTTSKSPFLIEDSVLIKKPEELQELVDRTFGGSDKKLTNVTSLPKLKTRKIYRSLGL